MGKGTGIQWCDDTVNPTTGCDGCELHVPGEGGPCYAGVQHEGRMARVLPKLYAKSFTEVRLAPGRMAKAAAASDLTGHARPEKPWLDGSPRVIFVGDMGDIFSRGISFEYLADEVMAAALSKQGRRHIWMWLTKRPSRMAEFAEWLSEERGIAWPANVWPGTSVTTRKTLRRLQGLKAVPARTRFVSAEPLREMVELSYWLPWLSLVIFGGESDQGALEAQPCDLAWIRKGIGDCRRAGVSPFVKQVGSSPILGDGEYIADDGMLRVVAVQDQSGNAFFRVCLKDSHGGDWSEWPADLRVREFPGVAQAVAP